MGYGCERGTIVLADEMMYEDKKKMKGLVRADKTLVGAQ